MGFKLKGAPYDKNDMNIGVYKQNLTDGSVGKSNHTGIIVQNGIDPLTEKTVIAHEKVHQIQQQKGELDYDDNNFYWKGKTYPRENLDEHNENLPWEKEAYKESNKQIKDQNKEMGSNKFKLKGHRGNNSPFKHLMERGLIGPTLKSGSSMNPGFDKLPKAVQNKILKKDGASMMERYGPAKKDPTGAGSNFSKKEQRRLKKSVKCTKGVDGGEYCTQKTNNKDNSSTKKTKEKQYLVQDDVTKVDKKDAAVVERNAQEAVKARKATGKSTIIPGSGKLEDGLISYKTKVTSGDAGTKAKKAVEGGSSSIDGQTKDQYVKSQKNQKELAGKAYDKFHENSSEKKTGSSRTTSRYKKKSDVGNLGDGGTRNSKKDKFKRSVTSTKGRIKKEDGSYKQSYGADSVNNLTGTSKTKNKLIGKGTKTKSYRLKNSDNTDANSKEVGAKKLERKDKRYTRKVTGAQKRDTGKAIGKKIQRADKFTKSKSTETTKVNFDKETNKIKGKSNLRDAGIGVTTKKTITKSAFNKSKNSKPKINKRRSM